MVSWRGREFRFRGDLYSQESTFPLVSIVARALAIYSDESLLVENMQPLFH